MMYTKGQKYYSTCNMANPNNPGYLQRIEEGERIGNYFTYRYAGVDKKGDWLIYDKKGNVIPVAQGTEEDKAVTGNGLPKFTGSMTHNFTYKNFDLTVALRGAAGFDIFNVHDFYFGLQSMSTNQLTTAYSKNSHITTGKNVITDYFIESGDYLKIDNITLGYTMNLNKKYIEENTFVRYGQQSLYIHEVHRCRSFYIRSEWTDTGYFRRRIQLLSVCLPVYFRFTS